jgi:hypothetical protein
MAGQFTKDHIFILPHAEEYRRFYDVSIDHLLETLNAPDIHEGLADSRYTSEKTGVNPSNQTAGKGKMW